MFRLIRSLNDSGLGSAKRLLLFCALLFPCAAAPIVPAMRVIAGESEAVYEDIEECLSVSQVDRLRSRRDPESVCCASEPTIGKHASLVSHLSAGQYFTGHRIANGMLAPLLC